MKTKLLSLVLVILLAALAFVSCNISSDKDDENQDPNQGGTENGGTPEGNVIYSPDTPVSIIKKADSKLSFDFNGVVDSIFVTTGKFATLNTDQGPAEPHEIIIGDSTRDLTAKAYEKLEAAYAKMLKKREDQGLDVKYTAGYAIYSEGGSVAIVWNDVSAEPLASDYFLANYFGTGDTLILKDGFLDVQVFSLLDKFREDLEASNKTKYDAIEIEYGPEVAQAIKNHLSMFDERYYLWLADLYDPGLYDEEGNPLGGGFYYSNSGRDTAGYGIDLESTKQALGFLSSSGMLVGTNINDALPERIKNEILAFIYSCQSPIDGYFYHPQWGTSVGTSRISRDLSWATGMLSDFGVKPYWNTPNGKAGMYGEPPGEDPVEPLSKPLSSKSAVVAVSAVVPAAKKWNGSSQLATLDAWDSYLRSYEDTIHTKSYSIGNNFSSQSGQITTRDKLAIENGELPDADGDGHADGGYIEKWEYYFNKWQYDYNGLWEHNKSVSGYDANGKAILVDDPNGVTYYAAINGLMKISGAYNSLGLKYPNADKAFAQAAYMVTYLGDGENWADLNGEEPSGSVDVYNPWVALCNLLSNITKYGNSNESDALRQQLKDNAYEMITVTTAKAARFRKDDGSYGYTWTSSPANSQGAPVAVPNTIEGDVNGGGIAFTGIYGNMCSALGISQPKPFGRADLLIFMDRLLALEPVIKDEAELVVVEPLTFDDEPEDETAPDGITGTLNTGSRRIVADPRGEGKVLSVTTVDGAGTTTTIKTSTAKNATQFVLEWEMCFTEVKKGSTTAYQISLGDAYMLTLGVTTDGVLTVADSSSTSSPATKINFAGSYDAFDWNTFRVEHYVLDVSQNSTVTKIFVNGNLRGVSTNYKGHESAKTPSTKYTQANFFMLKGTDFTVLYDNMFAYQTTETYVEEPIYDPDRIKNFDDVEAGSGNLPGGVTSNGGAVVAEPTEENPNNNVFLLDAVSEKLSITASAGAPTYNAYSVSAKMKIDASEGEVGVIYLSAGKIDGAYVAYAVTVYTEEGKTLAKLTELDANGKTGKSFTGLPVGEWFTLGVEFYPYHYLSAESSIIYLEGTPIGYGSMYYSIKNLEKAYSAFIFEMTGAGRVAFDDVVAERINKTFVNSENAEIATPDVELPSATITPDHNGKYDFDNDYLGSPFIAGINAVPHPNNAGCTIEVVADPTKASGRVLMHQIAKSDSPGNRNTITASKLSPADANCYVFEFDILSEYSTGGEIQIALNGNNGQLYNSNFIVRGDWINGTGTIKLNTKSDESNNQAFIPEIKAQGWVTVRLELYPAQGVMQVYYGGIYRGETNAVNLKNIGSVKSYSNAYIYHTYSSVCRLYFDNMTVEAIVKEYKAQTADLTTPAGLGKVEDGSGTPTVPDVPAEPDTPTEPDGPVSGGNSDIPENYTGKFDFESEQTSTFNVPGVTSSTEQGYAFISEGEGENRRVLYFASGAGSEDSLSFAALPLASGGVASVFEFDIYVDSAVGEGALYYITLDSGYILTVGVAADGTLILGDTSAIGNGANSQTLADGITAKAWNTIRIEQYYAENIVKISLNGNTVAVSDNCKASESGYTSATVAALKDASVTAIIDNVTAVESAEFTVSEVTHSQNHLGKTYVYAPVSEVIDFENGEEVYGNYWLNSTLQYITHSVVTDSADEVNKLLHINVTSTDTSSRDSYVATVKLANTGAATGAYVFSYDLRYDNFTVPTASARVGEMIFRVAGGYINHLRLMAATDGTFYFQACNDGGGKNTSGPNRDIIYCSGLDLADGKSHNVRVAFESQGLDSRLSIFVDDVCVADRVLSYHSVEMASSGAPVKDVVFRQNRGDYDVYLDNIILEYVGDGNVFAKK